MSGYVAISEGYEGAVDFRTQVPTLRGYVYNPVNSDPDNETELPAGEHIISFEFNWPEIREGDYFITLGVGIGMEVLNQVEQCWINQAIHIINTTHEKLIYGFFNNPMENFEVRKDHDE